MRGVTPPLDCSSAMWLMRRGMRCHGDHGDGGRVGHDGSLGVRYLAAVAPFVAVHCRCYQHWFPGLCDKFSAVLVPLVGAGLSESICPHFQFGLLAVDDNDILRMRGNWQTYIQTEERAAVNKSTCRWMHGKIDQGRGFMSQQLGSEARQGKQVNYTGLLNRLSLRSAHAQTHAVEPGPRTLAHALAAREVCRWG